MQGTFKCGKIQNTSLTSDRTLNVFTWITPFRYFSCVTVLLVKSKTKLNCDKIQNIALLRIKY